MKFNENRIKELIQNETTTWSSEDLSWFDQSYFEQFEFKSLPPEERQKIIAMLANDQAVMNHYLTLKNQHEMTAKKSNGKWLHWFMTKPVILMSSLACMVTVLWLINSNTNIKEEAIDQYRSPTEVLMYPQNNKVLTEPPTYLVVPNSEKAFKLELYTASQLIWGTAELETPRVYLPPEIRSKMASGLYNWKVMTADNQVIDNFYFTIEF